MSNQFSQMMSKEYNCPCTQKHVNVQLRQAEGDNQHETACGTLERCSHIGGCGCGVLKLVDGMSYTVDWKKCPFLTEH